MCGAGEAPEGGKAVAHPDGRASPGAPLRCEERCRSRSDVGGSPRTYERTSSTRFTMPVWRAQPGPEPEQVRFKYVSDLAFAPVPPEPGKGMSYGLTRFPNTWPAQRPLY